MVGIRLWLSPPSGPSGPGGRYIDRRFNDKIMAEISVFLISGRVNERKYCKIRSYEGE